MFFSHQKSLFIPNLLILFLFSHLVYVLLFLIIFSCSYIFLNFKIVSIFTLAKDCCTLPLYFRFGKSGGTLFYIVVSWQTYKYCRFLIIILWFERGQQRRDEEGQHALLWIYSEQSGICCWRHKSTLRCSKAFHTLNNRFMKSHKITIFGCLISKIIF